MNGTTVYLNPELKNLSGDAWLDAVRANEEELKTFASLLPEALGRAIISAGTNAIRVHFAEVDVFGQWGILVITERYDGYIEQALTVLTPSGHYSSNGMTLYESNHDERVKNIEESFYTRIETYIAEHPGTSHSEAWENVKPMANSELAELRETIWNELVAKVPES
ncbi:MAG: hypothetical protein ACWGQW_11675 [bacterium]